MSANIPSILGALLIIAGAVAHAQAPAQESEEARLRRMAELVAPHVVKNTDFDTDEPQNSQVTFILKDTRLVTNRYVDPLPFRRYVAYAERHPQSCNSAPAILAGLLESLINRIADVIERVGSDMDVASSEVFTPKRLRRQP